jgi:hypothetical protein
MQWPGHCMGGRRWADRNRYFYSGPIYALIAVTELQLFTLGKNQ